ncbi:MAG: ABC transporter permease subunit [Acidobacteria bacterium]|nr:ABC transporter permease subunit [Acidobacteriota bacterium]
MGVGTLVWRSAVQSRFVWLSVLVLLAGFQIVLAAQAASIDSTRSFDRLAEFVPAFLQRGLGSQALLLASFKGTLSFGYFHPVVAVLVAIVAMYMATEPAHDVEAGLVDLVLARPVARHRVITRSLLLSLGVIAGAVLMMASGTWIGLHAFASSGSDWPTPGLIAKLAINLAAVAACFAGIALAIAAGARRWSTAFATAGLIAVMAYLLDFLAIGWPPARTLSWISPYHYYPALPIVAGTATPWNSVAILFCVGAAFTALAYWRFQRRDL